MRQNLCNKCVEVVLIKNIFVFCGNFRFFWWIQITQFCHRSCIYGSTNPQIYPLYYFKSYINRSLWKSSFQIAGKSFLIMSNFLYFYSFILFAIAAVKKEKTEMSFQSSIGLNHVHFWNSSFSCLQLEKAINEGD